MNYQQALAYLYSLSDYERGGSYTRDREENLPREARLLELLGNPHQQFRNTLIAGSKGKGSTAAMLERVLRAAGLRTGLYTQPDLHTFRERIRVEGRLISEQEVAELIPEIRAAAEEIQRRGEFQYFITYEIATALAFLYFARRRVDHAVVEVGLGGRLDATNVTTPLVSVITSISYEHMDVLGDTLTKIATEKAGIIKPGGTLVTSAQAPEALLAIASIARQRQARMIRVGPAAGDPARAEVEAGLVPPLSYRFAPEGHDQNSQRFTIQAPDRTLRGLELSLLGEYQLENATAVLAVLDLLRAYGIAWDEPALREGLKAVRWSARMEIVGREPTIVVDGAHNADSVEKLLETVRATFPFQRLIIVLSLLRGKDIAGIVRALAGVDQVILTRVANPRTLSIEELRDAFARGAPRVRLATAETSREALDLALELAGREDLVCATGSLYLAGEALRWSAAHGNQITASAIEGIDHPG